MAKDKFEVEYGSGSQKQKLVMKSSIKNTNSNIASRNNTPKGTINKIGQKSIKNASRARVGQGEQVRVVKGKKIKIPALVAAIRQLSVMTNAGISIHDSIKEVADSTEDKAVKAVFATLDNDLNAGSSLKDAVEKFRPQLGDLTISMVALGEDTGNMAESLDKLSKMLQEVWENQQKFKKAMKYPITVMAALGIAFTVLMLFVVPQFREIFEELGAELPLPTIILLKMQYVLSNYGIFVAAGIGLGIYGLIYMYKNNPDFKAGWDRGILKVYLFGKIVFYSTMSRFNMVFAELTKAGLPITVSLETAVKMVDNTELKSKLGSVKNSVEQGLTLTEAIKNTGLYENMLLQMVSAGERSGSLDQMLGHVADYYKMKFDDIIDNISSYIEPIMLLAMAGMVIMLALGIFLPMWNLGSAVKN